MEYEQENRENYYALLIAILSPIEISIEESFAVLAGQIPFPVEQQPTPELAAEVARRIMDHTVVYRRLERRHNVNRAKIAKLVKAMREVYHECDQNRSA